MSRILDIIAKALSILLYPFFVPTYGIALFCYAYARQVLYMPVIWLVIAIVGTFVMTCLLPMTSIWILMKQGKVKDIQIEDGHQRTMPYLYATVGFGCWAYLLIAILHVPLYIACVSVGATVAIGLVMLINRWWKISAHLTGLGGLVGGLLSYCMGVGAIPSVGALCGWLAVSLILMYARLYLRAHTSAQVCAGWLLGISCTFLPYWIISYVA